MKSILNLALLVGLGLSATAVQAQGCGNSVDPFPATGQTESYPAFTVGSPIAVNDDGAVRAGGALSYTGTGPTIIDNNTMLEWEVLGQTSPSLTILEDGIGDIHDFRTRYWWSCPDTAGVPACLTWISIWDKVGLMNAENGGVGYAGHNDWRVPNVKELQSIIDYSAFGPAVDSVFDNGSHTGVCDPNSTGCSFTDGPGRINGESVGDPRHWSSTTASPANNDSPGPNQAWAVSFGGGAVRFDGKRRTFHVRLVRGGCLPGAPTGG